MQMFFSRGVLKNFTQVLSHIAKFLQIAFLQKTFGGCFFQFDKVTVQYWASAKLLFLIRNNVGWFLLKRFVDLFRVCYIISTNHPTLFCCLTCRKQNLYKVNSKSYLFQYQTFGSLDILILAEVNLILRKFKLDQEN